MNGNIAPDGWDMQSELRINGIDPMTQVSRIRDIVRKAGFGGGGDIIEDVADMALVAMMYRARKRSLLAANRALVTSDKIKGRLIQWLNAED